MSNPSPQQGITNKAWRQGTRSTANWKPSGRSTGTQKPNSFTGRRRTQRSGRSGSSFKKPRGKGTSSNFNFNNVRNSARASATAQGSPRPSPKPSSANNLSRFGKGLLGRFRPVLQQAQNIASTVGTRGASLARNLASSKFLAGANSVPVFALTAGNAIIWANNLRQLRNIYRGGGNFVLDFIPQTSRTIEQEIPPYRPFIEGGGTPGVTYGVRYSHANFSNGQVVPASAVFSSYWVTATAPLPSIGLWVNGNETELQQHYSISGRGIEPIHNRSTNGTYFPIVDGVTNFTRRFRGPGVYLHGWERVDREPDLENRPDIAEATTIIGGAPNSAIPQVEPSELVTPATGGFKPSSSSAIRGLGGVSNPNASPVNPLPNLNKPPETPATGTTPATLNSSPTSNTGELKPNSAQPPGLTDLIPATAIGVSPNPNGNGQVTRRVPEPTPTTPRTNRCRRGCGGASNGGTSFAPGSQANTQIAGLINDAFVQNPLLQRIDTTTQASRSILSNANHGLERIQNFASTAWEAARGDKILNAVSTVLLIHNGVMLSRNLGQTIGDAASVTLNALGIQDETGSPIDVNQFVGGKIQELLTSLLGQQNYEQLTQKIASANRVYQSTANLLDTTQALFDSARTISELTAENTGKIGNALKESGAVYENAYEDFVETINPQNVTQRRLERFRQGLEQIEDNVSTVSQISSEVVQTRENFTQLREEKETWQTEFNTLQQIRTDERTEEKENVQVTANISNSDFLPDESSSPGG